MRSRKTRITLYCGYLDNSAGCIGQREPDGSRSSGAEDSLSLQGDIATATLGVEGERNEFGLMDPDHAISIQGLLLW